MSRRFLTVVCVASVLASACSFQRVQTSKSVVVDDHMAHMSAADMSVPSVPRSALTSNYQGNTALPPSNNTAPARLKASPRHAEWVKIAWEPGSADSLMAWVVYPVTNAKAPVVVVVHEIYGLSTWVRGVADQVAAEGFIAVAPDLNSRVRGGPSTDELSNDSASKLIRGVNTGERNRGIIASANYGMTRPSAQPKYAVIGYCWGGQTVWAHAVNGGVKGYAGGVAYYGAFPYNSPGQPATTTSPAVPGTMSADSMAKISMPVMLLNGTGDARISASMPAIDSMMKAMKKDYVGTNYEGAIHGFLRAQDDPRSPRPAVVNAAGVTTRPAEPEAAVPAELAANLAATKDAWPKTVAFLKKNLGVK
jgi:carboxymethylenebutenolidase